VRPIWSLTRHFRIERRGEEEENLFTSPEETMESHACAVHKNESHASGRGVAHGLAGAMFSAWKCQRTADQVYVLRAPLASETEVSEAGCAGSTGDGDSDTSKRLRRPVPRSVGLGSGLCQSVGPERCQRITHGGIYACSRGRVGRVA
jgi:hypothetical protein